MIAHVYRILPFIACGGLNPPPFWPTGVDWCEVSAAASVDATDFMPLSHPASRTRDPCVVQEAVDVNTAREMFDLSLPDLGPYAIDYTKNGRFLLLGGRKGHLALMDTLRMDIQMEVRR